MATETASGEGKAHGLWCDGRGAALVGLVESPKCGHADPADCSLDLCTA